MNDDEITIKIDELQDWDWQKDIRLTEIYVKKKGTWKFNKYDKDPYPSIPHGHNIETGEKLDVYTGISYDPRTGKRKRQLNKKAIDFIQNDLNQHGFSLSLCKK